jgi:mannose/fructose-specific phosphotransferase system component IIA
MSTSYATFIIAHENLSASLLRSTEKVLGKQKNVFTYSNKHDSLPVLAQKVIDRILNIKFDHLVFFTDLKGGSCWNISNMLRREFPDLVILSGVNLPMLITYFNNLNELNFESLIKKVVDDGCRSIASTIG